jgi:hypothetical protein
MPGKRKDASLLATALEASSLSHATLRSKFEFSAVSITDSRSLSLKTSHHLSGISKVSETESSSGENWMFSNLAVCLEQLEGIPKINTRMTCIITDILLISKIKTAVAVK